MINCERAKGHAQMLLKLVPNVIGSGMSAGDQSSFPRTSLSKLGPTYRA